MTTPNPLPDAASRPSRRADAFVLRLAGLILAVAVIATVAVEATATAAALVAAAITGTVFLFLLADLVERGGRVR